MMLEMLYSAFSLLSSLNPWLFFSFLAPVKGVRISHLLNRGREKSNDHPSPSPNPFPSSEWKPRSLIVTWINNIPKVKLPSSDCHDHSAVLPNCQIY
jgi:hypothetical protein